jgi:hypothetical protein
LLASHSGIVLSNTGLGIFVEALTNGSLAKGSVRAGLRGRSPRFCSGFIWGQPHVFAAWKKERAVLGSRPSVVARQRSNPQPHGRGERGGRDGRRTKFDKAEALAEFKAAIAGVQFLKPKRVEVDPHWTVKLSRSERGTVYVVILKEGSEVEGSRNALPAGLDDQVAQHTFENLIAVCQRAAGRSFGSA